MSEREGGKGPEGVKAHEFVPVVNARSSLEAEFFKGLLVSNDIPAIIEDQASEALGYPMSILNQGVPVLVPDTMIEEAQAILADHEARKAEADEEDEGLDEGPVEGEAAEPEELPDDEPS